MWKHVVQKTEAYSQTQAEEYDDKNDDIDQMKPIALPWRPKISQKTMASSLRRIEYVEDKLLELIMKLSSRESKWGGGEVSLIDMRLK